MKKIMEELNVISIISWVITMMMIGAIWYLSANDISFKLMWNDVNRYCDSESIIALLYKLSNNTVILAGSTNVFSTIIRKLTEKSEEGDEIVEVIDSRKEESY